MSDFTIDPEFRDLIPPTDGVSRAELEASIDKNGCLDPLIVWTEERLLLDGHTRRDICLDTGKTWDVRYVSLPDRDAAKLWIIKHAIGRRNLTPDQVSLLRGRTYNAAKKPHGGTGANQHQEQIVQNELSAPSTAAILATEFGVSESTIKRDGQLAEAVDALKPVIPSIEQQVVSGQVPRTVAVQAAKAETPAEAIQILQRPAATKPAPAPTPAPAARQQAAKDDPVKVEKDHLLTRSQRWESLLKAEKKVLAKFLHKLATDLENSR